MKRIWIASIVCFATVATLHAQQRGPAPAPAAPTPAAAAVVPAGPAPKLADGHPDLSGVWWTGGDVGGRGYSQARDTVRFPSLYKPEAAAAAKKLADKDDPTLKCNPTAMGTLGVTMFDVGAVAQIVATPKFVVFLTETFHSYKVVPTDGRAPREDIPPSYRGDAVGKWEADTFVMETKNFTDDTWIYAEGQVSPHSDELRIVERYKRVDKNTLEIDATVHDPKMLTGPWTVPTRKLVLAPFDQILPLICSGTDTGALMDAAAKQQAK